MSTEKKINGAWIRLQLTPQEIAANGLPKPGDVVSLEWDEKHSPHTGVARVIKTNSTSPQDKMKSPQIGRDTDMADGTEGFPV